MAHKHRKQLWRILSISVFVLIFSLTAYVGTNTTKKTLERDETKLQVYTSFYAIYDFTNKIGGDKIQLYNLVPTGTEPHDWEPTAGNMLSLETADILFYNGLGMEHWVDTVANSLDNKNITFAALSSAPNLDLLNGTHDHDDNENHNDSDSIDPHIWLNPQNVVREAEYIKNILSEKDPKNKNYYEQNFNDFKKNLDLLDADYKEQLSTFSNRNIVVAHEAYSYLCNAYNLTQVAINGISADAEPSPAKMAEISDFVKNNNVKYIFTEELLNKKTAETIANETGAQLLILSPFEGLTDEQIQNGDDYISVMYKNLENIKKALGE